MGAWNLGDEPNLETIIFRLHSLNFGGLVNRFKQMLPTNASLPFRACLRLCSTLLRSNLGIEIRVHFTRRTSLSYVFTKSVQVPKMPRGSMRRYIYLHLVDFYGIWLIFMVHVGKYTSPMDPVGSGNSEPYSRLYWGVAFQLTLSRTAYITWGFLPSTVLL